MAQLLSLIFATLLNYLFRVTIFLDMQKYQPTSLVGFSSVLILLSVIMFLSDIDFMPDRYRNVSEFMFILLETIMCIFLIELFVILIWTKLEIGIEMVLKTMLMENQLNLYQEMGGDNLIGFIIVLIAASFTCYAAIVTSSLYHFTAFLFDLKEVIMTYFTSIKHNNSLLLIMKKKQINIQDQCCPQIHQDFDDNCVRRVSFTDDEPYEQKPQQRSRSRKTKR